MSLELDVNIEGFARKIKFGAYKGVVEALSFAYAESRKLISLSDHTQADLTAAGHPYAVRAPQPSFHAPPESIHTQSGDYLDGLQITNPRGMQDAILEGSVGNVDRKDAMLQGGTSTMVARPWAAYIQKTHNPRLQQIVLDAISAATR